MIDKPAQEADQAQVDAIKQQIRQILGELRRLAKSEVSDGEFLEQLGKRTLETTGAAGFAIWQIDPDQEITAVMESGVTSSRANLDEAQVAVHSRLIRTIGVNGQPTLIEPDARDVNSGQIINPMANLLLLKPLQDPALADKYVLELFQRPAIAPAARTGYMRYLEEIGEIFAAWRARHQLRHQSSRHGKQQRVLEFVRDIHSSLNPREVAYAAANDGRILAGCDRLSVLRFDGRVARVLAVSGQDDFDDRSNVVRKQQDLATQVCRSGQPVWFDGTETDEDMSRTLRELADDYLNESHSRTLGIVPLFNRSEESVEDNPDTPLEQREAIGAMIFEWFGQDIALDSAGTDLPMLTEHVGRSLANAHEHSSVFLLPVWKGIGKWKWLVQARTLPKTMAALIAVAVLLLFLFLFPWPLDMRVEGTLQPVDQQNVFANVDGVISTVHVDYGKEVKQGELLLELRNDELDYQLTSAQGQLQEVQQEIRSTSASALQANDQLPVEQAVAAASRLAALKEKETTIRQQLGRLEQMAEKLKVYSPIDGTVVTWDPVRQLTERPVSREDVVLVVAAVDSEWQMELYIPESKYGHISRYIAAQDDSQNRMPSVTFFAATDPNSTFEGQVTHIELHATEIQQRGSVVRAFAKFDKSQTPDLYVGAAVTARVHCGNASVGYAWFHELFEFIQSRVLF